MARRYRRRRNQRISSVVGDVVYIAARLPWWGALLLGVSSYLLISVVLTGFLESQIASLDGNQFLAVAEIRLGRIARVTNWVGIACLVAGIYFCLRNLLFTKHAGRRAC